MPSRTHLSWLAAFAGVGLVLVANSLSLRSQERVSLLSTREVLGSLTPSQWRNLERLLNRPVSADVGIFQGRTAEEFEALFAQPGAQFELQLPGDLGQLTDLSISLGQFGEKIVQFNRGIGRLVIGPGGPYGHIVVDDRFYSFSELGDGKIALIEKFYRDTVDHVDQSEFGTYPPTVDADCKTDATLSVLFVAKSSLKLTIAALSSKATIELSTIHYALKNSGVAATVNLAGVGIVDFATSGSMKNDLPKIAALPAIAKLRRETAADVVIVVTDHEEGGRSLKVLANRDSAFAVVSSANLNGPRYTAAHEFGHFLGAGHDVGSAHKDLPYAAGYIAGTRCTLMAVDPICDRRWLVFSGPDHWPAGSQQTIGSASMNNTRAVTKIFPYARQFNCKK